MDFSQRLQEALDRAEMKPSELSAITGIDKSSISRYLKGEYVPKQRKLSLLAQALNVSEGWLLTGEEQEPIKQAPELNNRDERDIQKRLEAIMNDLTDSDTVAMYNGGIPMDDNTKELMKAALENALRLSKLAAKEKYTPKKYKNKEQ